MTENISKLIHLISETGGKIYAVRDFALSEALRRFGYDSFSDNLDIEIYNIDKEQGKNILINNFIGIEIEGDLFYLDGISILISDKEMKQSAKEKALVLDSFFLDLESGEIKDFFEGLIDVQHGLVRGTDKNYFQTNVLNIFRAVQLAGQLNFKLSDDLINNQVPVFGDDLDKDFILNFWKDLLLNSSCPSAGMEALKEIGILKENYAELNNLIGVNQNPDWHQEGDVWVHTKMVVDAGARISRLYNLQEEDSFVLMLACICHDLGKPIVKRGSDEKPAKGHDKEGEIPTRTFLKRINVPEDIIEKVVPLVVEHMFTHNDDFTEKDGRLLAERMHPGRVRDLVYLAEADCQGMINSQEDNKARKKLLDMAEKNGFD